MDGGGCYCVGVTLRPKVRHAPRQPNTAFQLADPTLPDRCFLGVLREVCPIWIGWRARRRSYSLSREVPKVILETGPSVKGLFLLAGSAFARFSLQVVARAFAFSWSNSAWVIVPASRSCLADAI